MEYHKPPFLLKELKIEVTYRCPLACIHCSSDAMPSSDIELTKSDLMSIINQAIEMQVKEIAFSGGEPLLHPYITEAISMASKHNISTLLYTTGNVADFDSLIQEIKKSGLNKIIFSLYSENPELHESITRIRDSHSKTINAIKFCISKKVDTEIHFVALKRTYKNLISIAELSMKLGIKRLSVLRFVPQGRGNLLRKDMLTKKEYSELKADIEFLRKKGFDIRTGSPFNFLLLSNNPKCNSAIDRLIIAPDKNIYPCDAFKQIKAIEIVNTSKNSILDEEANLKKCWEDSAYLKAVRKYLTTQFAEQCTSCEHLELCLSGCLAQKVTNTGEFSKIPDPSCMRSYLKQAQGKDDE